MYRKNRLPVRSQRHDRMGRSAALSAVQDVAEVKGRNRNGGTDETVLRENKPGMYGGRMRIGLHDSDNTGFPNYALMKGSEKPCGIFFAVPG